MWWHFICGKTHTRTHYRYNGWWLGWKTLEYSFNINCVSIRRPNQELWSFYTFPPCVSWMISSYTLSKEIKISGIPSQDTVSSPHSCALIYGFISWANQKPSHSLNLKFHVFDLWFKVREFFLQWPPGLSQLISNAAALRSQRYDRSPAWQRNLWNSKWPSCSEENKGKWAVLQP